MARELRVAKDEVAEMMRLRAEGLPDYEIAYRLGRDATVIGRYLKRLDDTLAKIHCCREHGIGWDMARWLLDLPRDGISAYVASDHHDHPGNE